MNSSNPTQPPNIRAARPWLIIGGLFGLTGLMAAAYGWHGLGGDTFFDRGANIQLLHGVALIAVGWLATKLPGRLPLIIGLCLTLGTLFFSGSLYYLALTGERLFPHSAPIGGYFLMAGWGLVAWAGFRARG